MKRALKEILSTSIYLLCVVAISFLIVKYVAQRTEVIGSSMETTLSDGDNLILDKLTYKFSEPKRFDVIVFPFRNGSDKNYIKRIIGLPGEKVRIDLDGVIYIDDEPLYESFGREVINDPHLAFKEIILGPDEYFVLGDNRNNSEDSRFPEVGNIKRSEILGRAWVRIYPFTKISIVKDAR